MSDERTDRPWQRSRRLGDRRALRTPVLAIVAGYLGLTSLLCVPAPFALLLGILALRQLQRDHNPRGRARAIFGIVMGAVFSLPILVFAYALLTDNLDLFVAG